VNVFSVIFFKIYSGVLVRVVDRWNKLEQENSDKKRQCKRVQE